MFHQRLQQAGQKPNPHLLTGASALCWAIWLTRNDVVFDECQPKTFMQVLFRGTHWLRRWALLQRSNYIKEMMIQTYQSLETSGSNFFFFPWMVV
jgi:hypothetical protein